MPRRTAQQTTEVMERAPEIGVALRPGAAISPDVVNVFQQGISAGSSLRLVPLGGRAAGEAIALSVQAWVRNMAYDKDVWIDVCLSDQDKALHTESLPLAYQEAAGGGGDFFSIGAAVPSPVPTGARTLAYRLYGQMNGQLFTDGVLHTTELAVEAPTKARTPKTAKVETTTEPDSNGEEPAPKATRSRAATAKTAAPVMEPPAPAKAPTTARTTAKAPTTAPTPVKPDTAKTTKAASSFEAPAPKTRTTKPRTPKA